VGKLILDDFVAEDIHTILPLMYSDGLSFVEAEKAALGIDHAEVGEIAARAWRFPESLIDAIRNHHCNTQSTDNNELDLLVFLSNLIVHVISSRCEGIIYQIHPEILAQVDIKQSDVESIVELFPTEINAAAELLELSF